jgi:hypothetical protein
MEEIWKDIKNYEGLYQISNLGNVKRIATYRYSRKQNHAVLVYLTKQLKKTVGKKRIFKCYTMQ